MNQLCCRGTRMCLGAVLALLAFAATQAGADDIGPGSDLFYTVPDSTWTDEFFANPIPPDFFGPGSDPFDQRINLRGAGLDASADLGRTDCIVERLGTAYLPFPPSSDTIPIRVRALHLQGNITVTYNGGSYSEEWVVDIALSSLYDQDTGTMVITQTWSGGGTFVSVLPVLARAVFTRDGAIRVWDPLPDLYLVAAVPLVGHWVHDESLGEPYGLVRSPLGGAVDHDFNDTTAQVGYLGTNNFVAGLGAVYWLKDGKDVYGVIEDIWEAIEKAIHKIWPPTDATIQLGTCDLMKGNRPLCVVTTAFDCQSMGGVYGGDGSLCPKLPDYLCGDVNGDDNGPNIVDLTHLVAYLFTGGDAPPVMETADLDGPPYDGVVNIVDITYLVAYLFGGGPDPDCGFWDL